MLYHVTLWTAPVSYLSWVPTFSAIMIRAALGVQTSRQGEELKRGVVLEGDLPPQEALLLQLQLILLRTRTELMRVITRQVFVRVITNRLLERLWNDCCKDWYKQVFDVDRCRAPQHASEFP